MGFGLSGSPIGIQMQGADPTLVWVDGLTGPQAVDYHLSAYQKVSNILPRVWFIHYECAAYSFYQKYYVENNFI